MTVAKKTNVKLIKKVSTFLKNLTGSETMDMPAHTKFCSSCQDQPSIVFPGGGVFFWWQAGAVKALQETHNLDSFALRGASAGAVIAVLAGCKVDMDYALDVAERLALDNGIWGRPGGLMGVWGSILREWLDILLPENAADLCRDRVSVSVTSIHPTFPPLRHRSVTDFGTKEDLIQACLASVHIPFFLDGRAFSGHRGATCVDGSLTFVLRGKAWHFAPDDPEPALMVHHKADPALTARGWSFLQTLSKDGFREMFRLGYDHVATAAATAAAD